MEELFKKYSDKKYADLYDNIAGSGTSGKSFPMEIFKNKLEEYIFQPQLIFEQYKYDHYTLYENKPISRFVSQDDVKINNDIDISLNSFMYRCDEFKKQHNGLHIIFSGCSVTYGAGLLLEETWSKILYNKINEITPCSGYFNLAVPGSSIPDQIINIFKYCKEYGNPNYIFLNMPDKFRFYSISKKTNKIVDSLYSSECVGLMELITYQYYFMLDQYCKTNNIKLYSFSWSYPETFYSDLNKINDKKYTQNKFKIFDSFIDIPLESLFEYVYNYKQKNKKDKNAELARDNDHFGTGYHSYWSEIMYNKYIGDKK